MTEDEHRLFLMGYSDDQIKMIIEVAHQHNFNSEALGRVLLFHVKMDLMLHGDPDSDQKPIGIINSCQKRRLKKEKR
jgi:hypothetical protein